MNRGRYRAVRVKHGVIRVHRRSAIVVTLGLVFLSCLALYSLTLGDYGLGFGA